MFETVETSKTIQVMLVDDHDMVRLGLVYVLADYADIEIVAEASNGEFAIGLCRQLRPDVILMDIHMPRVDGIEATRLIRCLCPETQVIALTSYLEDSDIQGMLEAGAISYLLKDVTPDELATAIRSACSGQPTLASEVAQRLIYMMHHHYLPPLGHDLSDREIEVLVLLAKGQTNRQIAGHLNIATSTVKNHVSNILKKLGENSRTRAAALALEQKLIG